MKKTIFNIFAILFSFNTIVACDTICHSYTEEEKIYHPYYSTDGSFLTKEYKNELPQLLKEAYTFNNYIHYFSEKITNEKEIKSRCLPTLNNVYFETIKLFQEKYHTMQSSSLTSFERKNIRDAILKEQADALFMATESAIEKIKTIKRTLYKPLFISLLSFIIAAISYAEYNILIHSRWQRKNAEIKLHFSYKLKNNYIAAIATCNSIYCMFYFLKYNLREIKIVEAFNKTYILTQNMLQKNFNYKAIKNIINLNAKAYTTT